MTNLAWKLFITAHPGATEYPDDMTRQLWERVASAAIEELRAKQWAIFSPLH
jgi:hypothetical protein